MRAVQTRSGYVARTHPADRHDFIRVQGARENNLKNVMDAADFSCGWVIQGLVSFLELRATQGAGACVSEMEAPEARPSHWEDRFVGFQSAASLDQVIT